MPCGALLTPPPSFPSPLCRKYIEKDPALERRFQQVYVDQPSVAQTVSILRGLRERYELHHGVRISDSALVEAAVLSDRWVGLGLEWGSRPNEFGGCGEAAGVCLKGCFCWYTYLI